MSISFGLKSKGSKRKAAASLPAFAEPDNEEPEAVLSESQTLAESQRLQVSSSVLEQQCSLLVFDKGLFSVFNTW